MIRTIELPKAIKELLITLDGGGIRGYCSLLILQYLMHKIAELERPRALNSFHPLIPQNSISEASVELPRHPLIMPGEMDEESLRRTSQYLPCHYFDYIAGTSTGGFVSLMTDRTTY